MLAGTLVNPKNDRSVSFIVLMLPLPASCEGPLFVYAVMICSDENDFNNKSKEMASFFLHRNYTLTVVDLAL